MADATVATIAKKAGLSSGIVAHYFGDKDGLLNAAMRQILRELKDAVARYRADASDDPREQLRAIVDGFDDSQINGTAMRVWLTFQAPACTGTGPAAARQRPAPVLQPVPPVHRLLPHPQARLAARGLAAMIDGLWLRGLVSGQFTPTSPGASPTATSTSSCRLPRYKRFSTRVRPDHPAVNSSTSASASMPPAARPSRPSTPPVR